MGFFSNAQGQLTPQSMVRTDRISNSSELLASMEQIQSKIAEKMRGQHFLDGRTDGHRLESHPISSPFHMVILADE